MKQVLMQRGQAHVEEVAAPLAAPGHVLVAVEYSCISAGTEIAALSMGGEPLWRRALKQPEHVKKVLHMAASQGWQKTASVVKDHLNSGQPTGYSAAGCVIEVGTGVKKFKIGDRVACAGAQCAHHADIICVPENLTTPIPAGLPTHEAATVTLGAIALQGVRRANPTLGETFVVIGLGILGQLTVQLLQANGCQVIGIDLDEQRVALAKSLGMAMGFSAAENDTEAQVKRLIDGNGADGVIITAATSSNQVIAQAFSYCRKKGRVVLVGDVGLDIRRADIYQKELDFFISCSYGPGRYDARYEEDGLDYPIGYVRWTENRNMSEYLRLCANQRVRVGPLIQAAYPMEQAEQAYTALKNAQLRPLIVLLQYHPQIPEPKKLQRKIINFVGKTRSGVLRVALVGAGGFAKGVHLQNLAALANQFHLQAVVSRSGHNALATAKQFGASYSTTDYQAVLGDPEVDAVLIVTRHHLHSAMTLQALQAGKHVLVEKPLALTHHELAAIRQFYNNHEGQADTPLLLVGYNRRFSPLITPLYPFLAARANPMIINYRMNAGYIPYDHWVHGEEGGGRNLGEACHIYDLFTALTNSQAVSVTARTIAPATAHYRQDDNFVTTVTFADGSVATLTYTALGNKEHPKEQMEIFWDGKTAIMNDYKSLHVLGAQVKAPTFKHANKGQKEELMAFATAINKTGEWPIPYWQLLQTSEIAFAVEEEIRK